MKKTRKLLAMLVIMIMIFHSMMTLLSGISMAEPDDPDPNNPPATITVEITADNDGSVRFVDDQGNELENQSSGQTLRYTYDEGENDFCDFNVRDGGTILTFTKVTEQIGEQFHDKYIIEGLESNQDLYLVSPNVNLGAIQIFYSGEPQGMFDNIIQGLWATQSFYNLDANATNYQFYIQRNNGGNNPVDDDTVYRVDFGTASWNIEGQENPVVASWGDTDLTNGEVNLRPNDDIELSNWDGSKMKATVTVDEQSEHPFSVRLSVRYDDHDEKFYARLADREDPNSVYPPEPNTYRLLFKVEELGEGDDPINNPPPPMEDTVYTVDFGEASWFVRNETTVASIDELDITNGTVEIRGDREIILSNWQPDLMQAVILVHNEENMKIRLNVQLDEQTGNGITRIMDIQAHGFGYEAGQLVEFMVEPYEGERPEYNLLPADTTASISITSPAEYARSYRNAGISINDYPCDFYRDLGLDPEHDEFPESVEIENFEYNYNDIQYEGENAGKVKLGFSAIFLSKYIGTITIVGKDENNQTLYTENVTVADYIDYTDRQDWLDHYSGQTVGFDVYVNKADRYEFTVSLNGMDEDLDEGSNIAIGNFLWSYEEDGAGHDGYVGNTRLEVIAVTYWVDDNHDGQEEEYTISGREAIDNNKYIEYGRSAVTESLVVPEGSRVTMRITPYPGYQVLTFGSNDNPIVTGDAISEFTFPAHKGNFHLSAQAVHVNDIVDTENAQNVNAGNIELSAGVIEHGSAVLSVEDANLSNEKIAEFEENAGDYEITDYLDMHLSQVIYKGTADDVWESNISQLNQDDSTDKKATIFLELEEDLSDKNIIVVHNVGDGDEYEIIEIEGYNTETGVLTFETDSFSSYAIAVKDKPAENPSNPEDPENPTNPENPEDPSNPENPENPGEPEEEPKDQVKYTVETDGFIAIFSDDEGHTFKLHVDSVMNLTDEELEAMEMTRKEYEEIKNTIIKLLEKYGTVIDVYEIWIEDPANQYSHDGELTLKIKITDEMKKYDSFKLICIDDGKIGDKVTLKAEGDYLVGNPFHLSSYALVGEKTETVTSANPKTGDNILTIVTIFALSTIGMIVVFKSNKKNKTTKK